MADQVDPREEMDALLDALLRFAEEQLGKHGEFFPFGGSVGVDGTVRMAHVFSGDEHPPSQQVIDDLYSGLIASAASGEIRGSAVCSDVRPTGTDAGDAIQVAIEHAHADPVIVFMPYKRRRLRGVEYGELFATPGERRVFAG